MNANRHIDQDQLPLFAMQLLDPDEAEAVVLHVSHCEQCRRALAEVQGDLAVFALTAEVHSPPALARERLLTQLRREKKPRQPGSQARERAVSGLGRPTAEGNHDRWPAERGGTDVVSGGVRRDPEVSPARSASGRLARVLPWGGWVVAAGLAVTAGNLLHQRETLRRAVAAETAETQRLAADASLAREVLETLTDRNAMRVTLTRSKEAPVPVGRLSYLPEKGALVFFASSLAPLGPYKTYELWLIPADGRDPMPAGTFVPDAHGNAGVILPPLPTGVPAKAFGITIEDEGGSQTPTMPIVMAGT